MYFSVFRGGGHEAHSPIELNQVQGLLLELGEGILLPGTLNFYPYEPTPVDSQYIGKSDPLVGSSVGLEVESGEFSSEHFENTLHDAGFWFTGHED